MSIIGVAPEMFTCSTYTGVYFRFQLLSQFKIHGFPPSKTELASHIFELA